MAKEHSVYELNRIQQYIMQMRPVLKKEALFSDGTKDYRNPTEPEAGEKVTIRFRTGKNNVDIVWLCTDCEHYKMKKTESDREFDYYAVEMTMGEEPFYYYFEVASGLLHVFFDRYGVSKERRDAYRFCIIPGFSTPEWSKGAVMYQILVDRFYNGDLANDVLTDEYYYIQTPSKKMEDWNQCPSDFSVGEFYGGDLEGVRQKLNYLQNLGVEVIYFNPLFVSPSNHKYDIQDYDHIDPHYGKIVVDEGELLQSGTTDNSKATRYVNRVTNLKNLEASNAFFAELVREIHARGMKVILDGVFNHCGSFNKWLDREKIYHANGDYEDGAFLSKESPYRSFFGFRDENAWPDNTTYEGWWDYDTLPKLNYEGSKELYDYILGIAAKWVSEPYHVDGWRLDVANEVDRGFWRDFHRAAHEENPESVMIGEIWESSETWLNGDMFDSTMNYDFRKNCRDFFALRKISAEEFHDRIVKMLLRYRTGTLRGQLNLLDSHDVNRFLSYCEGDLRRFRLAEVFLFTSPGIPCVFYGDELGMDGSSETTLRGPMPWEKVQDEEDDFFSRLIAIRKEHEELTYGDYTLRYMDHDGGYIYQRTWGDHKITVCLNNGSTTIDLREYLGKGSVLLSESYEAGKLGSMGYAIIEEK